MRKSIFFILLATAAMPALAAVQNEDRSGDRRAARAERSESGDGQKAMRSQRSARSERGDGQPSTQTQRATRSERGDAAQGAFSVQRAERSRAVMRASDADSGPSSSGNSQRRIRTGSRSNNVDQPAPVAVRDSTEGVTNWRARERRSPRTTSPNIPTTTEPTTTRDSGREGSGITWGDRSSDGQTSTTTTRSTNWRDRDHDGDRDGRRWSSDWRKDHRYNWRTHRSRYSSLFRLGRYYDPFGYGYRRWSIGYNLWPNYYRSNYWLDDPWRYRLPPAYGPYRWIRYYNDALLVNIYNGQVVDVIYGFFW